MIVLRFMTEAEKNSYLAGQKLINVTKHQNAGLRTTSIGSCFAELTAERDADKWLRKLMGIGTCDYCIVFDTEDFKESLVESVATYADDIDFDKGKTMEVREWCTTSYSIDTHPYKHIGKCPSVIELIHGKKIDWL